LIQQHSSTWWIIISMNHAEETHRKNYGR
jgi:hypothetical protein